MYKKIIKHYLSSFLVAVVPDIREAGPDPTTPCMYRLECLL